MVAGATILVTSQSYKSRETDKSAQYNSLFELKLDEKVYLPKAKKELAVSLITINDNRCPENVQCVTAGKAVAEVKLTSKVGSEVVTKLVLENSADKDTIAVTLDKANYSIILSEVDRLFANKATLLVKKGAI